MAGAVLALAAAVIVDGPRGAAGMALGLCGAAIGVAGIAMVVGRIGHEAPLGSKGRYGVVFPVLVFLMKLPVYAALGMLANRLGGAAFGCFLSGIVLVYFGVVAWASARS